jgi:hypothetical protein
MNQTHPPQGENESTGAGFQSFPTPVTYPTLTKKCHYLCMVMSYMVVYINSILLLYLSIYVFSA